MSDYYDILFLGTSLPHCISSYTNSKNKYKVLMVDRNSSYGSSLQTLSYSMLCKMFKIEPKTELLKFDKMFNIDLTPKFILADGKMKEFIVDNNLENLVSFTNVQGSFVYRDKCLRLVPTSEKSSVTSKLIYFMQKPRVANFFWNVRKYCEMKESLYRMENESGRNGSCSDRNDANGKKDDINGKKYDSNYTGDCNNNDDNINDPYNNNANNTNFNINNEEFVMKTMKNKFECKKTMLEEFEYYKLSTNSIEIIGHAIALNLDDTYLKKHPIETYDKIYYFIRSLMCLNDKMSPFIYPLYGLSEICQAFSRRAGQYGCTFMLNVEVQEIKRNDGSTLYDINDQMNDMSINEKKDQRNINDKMNDMSINEKKDQKNINDQMNEMSINENKEQKNINDQMNDMSINNGARFTVKLKQFNDEVTVQCNKIISESSYFNLKQVENKEIITQICIVKGNIPMIDAKISSCHIILLASEFKRKNDIFIAVLGERENVAPERYKVAIISTIKEKSNHETELDFVVAMMGDVKENICFVRNISNEANLDDSVVITKDVDQTTHFETLYDEIVRIAHIKK